MNPALIHSLRIPGLIKIDSSGGKDLLLSRRATIMFSGCLFAVAASFSFLLPAISAAPAQTGKTVTLAKIYTDSATGRVHIVDSDGKVIIPPPEKGQAGVDFLKIADDKHTAGWLVDEKIDDGTSYPIALTLVVYRSGKILHRFGDGMVIANWCFLEGGEQVAFYTNKLHGDLAPHYELHGVASGRLVEKYDGHPGPHAPAWTRDLADQ